MPGSRSVLICVALPEEARPLRRLLAPVDGVRLRVTGMGQANAVAGLRTAWREATPGLVISAGLAGGLNPLWRHGDVLMFASPGCPLEPALLAAGAQRGIFHSAEHMIITAAEKRRLRERTGADAVEMESRAIQQACAGARVPWATVRVISDVAEEDLPLDFNRFSRPDGSLSWGRLVRAVAASPRVIRPLLELRRRTSQAALRLAALLVTALRDRWD